MSKNREGWQGWDDYAPFYDWENARTRKREDVAFWRQLATRVKGPVLELGSGTGRISLPLMRAGVSLVGIDRSQLMLRRAARRSKALGSRRRQRGRITLVRGDIRVLPFAPHRFEMVIAPYGVLQSMLSEHDLAAALGSVSRVLKAGGIFGVDLVPDVPNWKEYRNQVQLRGPAGRGAHLTLVESVRQDRRRHLTTFVQKYIERRGSKKTPHQFELTFRTLPVRAMVRRLEAAGFVVEAILGDYRGRPWDARSDVWLLLARRVRK
jgi:ubiquinone/menaquinone biosynthesis C-methylase UbiE